METRGNCFPSQTAIGAEYPPPSSAMALHARGASLSARGESSKSLSQDQTLIRTLGTRHRAAIGITEETDAVALVVSEETGFISIACRGRLKRDIQSDKILRYLSTLLLSSEMDSIKNFFGTMAENDERGSAFAFTKTSVQED